MKLHFGYLLFPHLLLFDKFPYVDTSKKFLFVCSHLRQSREKIFSIALCLYGNVKPLLGCEHFEQDSNQTEEAQTYTFTRSYGLCHTNTKLLLLFCFFCISYGGGNISGVRLRFMTSLMLFCVSCCVNVRSNIDTFFCCWCQIVTLNTHYPYWKVLCHCSKKYLQSKCRSVSF